MIIEELVNLGHLGCADLSHLSKIGEVRIVSLHLSG